MDRAHKCLEKVKLVMGQDFIQKFQTNQLISFFGKAINYYFILIIIILILNSLKFKIVSYKYIFYY